MTKSRISLETEMVSKARVKACRVLDEALSLHQELWPNVDEDIAKARAKLRRRLCIVLQALDKQGD